MFSFKFLCIFHPKNNFYNTSKYDFKKLLDDSESIEENFYNYLDGFSDEVKDIMTKFKVRDQIQKLAEHNILYLIVDKFNEEDQPNQLVRRYGGRDLTDEEMLEVYIEKLKKVGGESTGHYNVALAIVDENGKVYSREFKPERLFVSKPSTTLQKGFPLSSLAYDKKTGKYLSEMNAMEKIAYEQDAMIKQREFIEESLQK